MTICFDRAALKERITHSGVCHRLPSLKLKETAKNAIYALKNLPVPVSAHQILHLILKSVLEDYVQGAQILCSVESAPEWRHWRIPDG